MEGHAPTEADFTKTLTIVLLAEYFAVAAAHAASIALADGPATIALCAKIASYWLFGGVLAINLCTLAGAFAMRRSENAAFARTSLTMTAAQVMILAASYMNGRLAFQAGAAALTALMLFAVSRTEGNFLRPNPR
ncbi:MAG TPA: hypothetical protein VL426_01445 [Candidatus Binatia bacterium]|nr:hypothetical protein [Candidatus Binatia bacterium]